MQLAYCRKSSEGEDRQVQSIADQVEWCKNEAGRRGMQIQEFFTDEKTGTKPHVRDGYNQMIDFISKENEKVIVYAWELSRIARNPIDGGYIQYLLMHDKIEIITSTGVYDRYTSQIVLGVLFGQNSQYSIDLSRNVKRGIDSKLRKGGWNNIAPIGYLNDTETKTLKLDTQRHLYIKKAFQYRYEGYSYDTIAKFLFKQGLRSRNHKEVGRCLIERMVKNKFYCGIITLKDGTEIEGLHKPIVDLELFNKVNMVNKTKSKEFKRDKLFFAFKGILTCGECGSTITAFKKKGHTYYYCKKNKGGVKCSQGCLREEDLVKIMVKEIGKIEMPDEMVELAKQAIKDKADLRTIEDVEIRKSITASLDRLDIRENNLYDMRMDGNINDEKYKEKMKEIQKDKGIFRNQLEKLDEVKPQVYSNAFSLVELLKNPLLVWNGANYEERGEIQKMIWLNLTIKDKKLISYRANELFEIAFQHFVSIGGPNTTKVELFVNAIINFFILNEHDGFTELYEKKLKKIINSA